MKQKNNTPLYSLKNVVWLVTLLLYVNLLPYTCRLINGFDWALQYVPNGADAGIGLLFFAMFNSVAWLPLAGAQLLRSGLPVTFYSVVLVTSLLLVFFHADYDLSSDAQAAIGLVVFPVITAAATVALGSVIALGEWFWNRQRRGCRELNNDW